MHSYTYLILMIPPKMMTVLTDGRTNERNKRRNGQMVGANTHINIHTYEICKREREN